MPNCKSFLLTEAERKHVRRCARCQQHQDASSGVFIDQIRELILQDCRISAKSVAEQLGTSREPVGSIIHEDFDMQELSAK